MRLNELKPATGAKKNKKRVGRGSGSGLGKTAGRGTKGQKSRSGGGVPPWFEGGQMPLQRRVPKRGFTNIFRTEYEVVNVQDLDRFEAGSAVGPDELKAAGLVRKKAKRIKLLGDGDISKGLTLRVHKASASAIAKVEAAGGKVELI
ncbi:LSU ribosomal protein L15P [Desulfacinum hydrothermale DSM 13146]|uniref:Large ribosomal subunit protein uL15 n=1 Tax=Desulfacinum hydrothermale DSM 13146 TaxID=1121390 RepID=A0A1W1XQ78_9BACT|nr:50S ribosomal protein L15 [Desulfacinum hydrothermale]SMC26123.1 LSU ribosomal protein L15P [Desulfacinum hydrothermale DSM 13146]